jgi:hypothetical protein
MQSSERDLFSAAKHLLAKIDAPNGAVSISTFTVADRGLALRVFLRPDFRHLARRVPLEWEGFSVMCEIADTPRSLGTRAL